jgi:hypothetical protein
MQQLISTNYKTCLTNKQITELTNKLPIMAEWTERAELLFKKKKD